MPGCFFCSEGNPLVLEDHHLVPKNIGPVGVSDTVTLCANCHKKLHYLLRPLEKHVQLLEKGEEAYPAETADITIILDNKRKTNQLLDLLKGISLIDEVIEIMKINYGVDREEVMELIRRLKEAGVIYEPEPGWIKIV